MKQLIFFLICVVGLTYNVSAQLIANPDLGYTVKDSTIEFYPTDNDNLGTPMTLVASVNGAALHGTFTISASFPFKATYIPNTGYIGGDTMYYKLTDPSNSNITVTAINILTENMSINNIWPGDFNHDGIVSVLDVLFLSNALYQSEKAGFNRQSKWGPYFCDSWNGNQWGVNLKYIDGTGNGTIDQSDLNMVLSNFEKSRSGNMISNPDYTPFYANKTLNIFSKLRKKNLNLGDTMLIDLYFGDTSGLLSSQRYATAFAFGFGFDAANKTALKNAKMWYEPTGNWLTEGSSNQIEFSYKKSKEATIEIALARTNHYHKNVNPTCGMSLQLTSKDKYTASSLGEVYSTVTGGTAPYIYSWSSGGSSPIVVGINNSFPATNTLTVTDASGCTVSGSVTVINRDKTGKGSLGIVKVIIDDDIIQIMNNPTKKLDLTFTTPYAIDEMIPEFVNLVTSTTTYKEISAIKVIKARNEVSIMKAINDGLEISLQDNTEMIQKVELVDISGIKSSLIHTIRDLKAHCSISDKSEGVYILLITTDKGMYAEKVIK